jgi:peptidoglycan/xylan/chitin deacetylase (PgdA/CDA1 family)
VFFRPPGGLSSDAVIQVAQARGLALLHWSVDPQDWERSDPAAIEQAVLNTVTDGDVILLHDMSASSVQAALDIVDTLQGQGYRFVTVSELAKLRNVPIRPGRMYERFPPKAETMK